MGPWLRPKVGPSCFSRQSLMSNLYEMSMMSGKKVYRGMFLCLAAYHRTTPSGVDELSQSGPHFVADALGDASPTHHSWASFS
jgi:hypothetical protein